MARISRKVGSALEQFKEEAKRTITALVTKLKDWWTKVKDYLKTSAGDTWKTVDEMFAQFDREGYNISSADYSTTKKQCVHAVARLPSPPPLLPSPPSFPPPPCPSPLPSPPSYPPPPCLSPVTQ